MFTASTKTRHQPGNASQIHLPDSSSQNPIYLIAPTSAGSLGDQALCQGLIDGLEKHFGETKLIEVLIKRRHKPQVLRFGSLPTFNLNSGSPFALLRLRRQLKTAKAVIIIGADTLDGSYAIKKNLIWFKLADLAASLGIPTSIMSFSFSKKPVHQVVERLRNINPNIQFYSRDPVSKDRFEAFTGKHCKLTADLAFLMKAGAHLNTTVSSWVAEKRATRSFIIGLNVNPLGMQQHKEKMVESYRQALTNLLDKSPNRAILMIPHDFREGQSDQEIMSEIKNALPTSLQNQVLLAEGPFDAWDAKKIVSSVDVLITGRMHLAIAAMSQGVPAFGLAYKDKFEGLMQHFSLSDNLIPREKTLLPDTLFKFLTHAINQHADVRTKIYSRLPEVNERSLANLNSLIHTNHSE